MKWDAIQQVVRIVLYTLGGVVFGDGIAESELFQQAVGGLVAVFSFVWWLVWERSIQGEIETRRLK